MSAAGQARGRPAEAAGSTAEALFPAEAAGSGEHRRSNTAGHPGVPPSGNINPLGISAYASLDFNE
ncbi:hypothetical protein GTS_40970 [Gandjariella thermophila]|uniref:Uncharacterized protein n=1 Tax=Gandjariella thermophila TaxID=1931992 RepID=A0A4D4JA69_9PSEU|nr:hypothetical protein GTS_40970 [Gandjariella thermophila]